MRVLVIEDDDRIREDVQTALEAAGYIVDVETSGDEGWFLGETETYGAVVLDLGLPEMDGLTILKRWRKTGRTMPVLILTGRQGRTDEAIVFVVSSVLVSTLRSSAATPATIGLAKLVPHRDCPSGTLTQTQPGAATSTQGP